MKAEWGQSFYEIALENRISKQIYFCFAVYSIIKSPYLALTLPTKIMYANIDQIHSTPQNFPSRTVLHGLDLSVNGYEDEAINYFANRYMNKVGLDKSYCNFTKAFTSLHSAF